LNERIVRIAAAGSVDDGKSTLIGRLLVETGSLFDDQLTEIDNASAQRGRRGRDLAFATDGLREERERNITLDAAYRHLQIGPRRFLLADAPGHAEYTQNMVTAASTADLLILLVDASRETALQTHRHLAIAAWLQRPVLLAINKMDMVDYDQEIYEKLSMQFTAFGRHLGCPQVEAIPISAFHGDNVTERSSAMPWYAGAPLLQQLANFPLPSKVAPSAEPALLVQNVFSYHGLTIATGTLQGAALAVGNRLGSATVARLWVAGEETETAHAGQPIAAGLLPTVNVARGDLLSLNSILSGRFLATVFWMNSDPLRLFIRYQLRIGPRVMNATVRRIANLIELQSGCRHTATIVAANELAELEIELDEEAPMARYSQDRDLGSFILVDPKGTTVAAGTIDRILPKRAESASGAPVFWLTGLSGAGKSSIAEATVEHLRAAGVEVAHLDGDALRSGLCSDLGFTDGDRLENIRRTAEVAKLIAEQGRPVVCSLISPLVAHREQARRVLGQTYHEVFIRCELDECVRRDPKGLYAQALAGKIPHFTGIGAPYEPPVSPDLILDTESMDLQECVNRLATFVHSEFAP
jgi:bifunctional enzyme CysN/CysC